MREYLTVFLVAVTVTYLLAVLAREVALRFGAVAQVRDRDVHAEPIPYFGGIAMYGGLVAAYVVARHLPFLSRAGEQVLADAGVVLAAGGMVCALGVLDDLFELDALTKFGGQVLAAGFLVYNGVQFYYIWLPGDERAHPRHLPGGAGHGLPRGGHHQRGQLHRRAGRARRRA